MRYYVTTQGRGGLTLFLVDRTKTKKRWWSTSLYNAMAFVKESAAEYSAKNLRYKNPTVVDSRIAKMLESENDHKEATNDIHPFSSEGLGQW